MLKKIFYLDTRSLALMRVVLGLTFLFDLFNRFGDINAFYSDGGILTRAEYLSHFGVKSKWSLLLVSGEDWFVFSLFSVGVIAGIFFIKGIRTRSAALIVWILYMSLHARLPAINHGGDNMMRLLFFYSFFLPMGAAYSADKVLNSKWLEVPQKYFSSFSILLFVQALLIYWFTVYYKWHPHYISDFSAIYYALQLEAFTTPVGHFLKDIPALGKVLTFMTVLIEGLGPLLLLIPFKQAWMRGTAVSLFFALHIGIWVTFILGSFPPACIALWCAFIPSEFWNWLGTKIPRGEGMTLYYDEDCGFCRKFCLLVKEALFLKALQVEKAQSDKTANKLMNEHYSWVLESDEEYYYKFSAFRKLVAHSYFSPFAGLLFFQKFGDVVYSYLAKRRGLLGTCLNKVGSSNPYWPVKWKGQVFGVVLSLMIVAWNVEGTWAIRGFDIKRPFTDFVFALQLNQQWNMFAPTPMKSDGWFVFKAELENGKEWDIYFDEPVDLVSKPYPMRSRYKNTQWRKFLISVWYKKNANYRKYLARWVCRRWNRSHEGEEKADRLQIYFMKEMTPPPGGSLKNPEPVSVWNGACAY